MTARVLILTDHLTLTPEVSAAVRARAARGAATFRVVVTNPSRAEFHLHHPGRHDAVVAARPQLEQLLADLLPAAGGAVSGKVSIRHDHFDAVEDDLHEQPADEVLLAVHEGDVMRRLHLDLRHRLPHLGLVVVEDPAPAH
ncbi:MAG: hypothetical protein JWO22_1663 [Frankiales bacterium]|nr:hypothetical protein [Frankiales bacterium]